MTIGSKRLVGWFGHFFLEKKKKKSKFLRKSELIQKDVCMWNKVC